MKRFLLGAAFMVAAATTAQASSAFIDQLGPNMGASTTAKSVSLDNLVLPDDSHFAAIADARSQVGALEENMAILKQSGFANIVGMQQTGKSNYGLILQSGAMNSVNVAQLGNNNIGIITQMGYGNSVSLNQSGSNHAAMVSQQGHGNVAIISQQ